MYDTEHIKAEYSRLDRICGIDSSGIDVKLSGRLKRKLGYFRCGTGLRPEIVISKSVLNDEPLFYETIRHEYAHAVVYFRHPFEKHAHDAVWKAVCREVGCSPKATVKTASTSSDSRQNEAKYIIRCDCCGAETRYLKAGKYVNMMLSGKSRRLVCRKCGRNRLTLYTLR